MNSNPNQIEASRYIKKMIVRDDRLSVKIVALPVGKAQFSVAIQSIKEYLQKQGIVYGVLDHALDLIYEQNLFHQEIEVARGVSPIHGLPGKLVRILPSKKQQGSNPNIISAGTQLFELVDAVQGINGTDVYGEVIQANAGGMPVPVLGRGVKQTGNQIFAELDGYLQADGEEIAIINEYVISGNVDRYIGNVEFAGDVKVLGDVNEGYVIAAGGSVIVEGLVDSSSIISGGDITIKKGLLGGNRSTISAKGNIRIHFIEQAASVEAGKSVYTNMILNSKVYAMDQVVVEGDEGMIIGGRTVAHNLIQCKEAGFKSFVKTELIVGLTNDRLEELERTQQVYDLLAAETEEVRKSIAYLEEKQMSASGDAHQKIKQDLDEYTMKRSYNLGILVELKDRLEKLRSQKNTIARILVDKTIYPLTICNVNNHLYEFTEHMSHRCMFADENEVLIIDYDDQIHIGQ